MYIIFCLYFKEFNVTLSRLCHALVPGAIEQFSGQVMAQGTNVKPDR